MSEETAWGSPVHRVFEPANTVMSDALALTKQCAAETIHVLDRIDPPHTDPLGPMLIDTIHPQVLSSTVSPPTMHVIDAGLLEQPHATVGSQEYTYSCEGPTRERRSINTRARLFELIVILDSRIDGGGERGMDHCEKSKALSIVCVGHPFSFHLE